MNITRLQYQLNLEDNFYEFSEQQQLIYFLVSKSDEIVYIGISDTKNVFGRIKSHEKDKDFNSVKYTVLSGLSRYRSERMESGLISLLRPKYNIKDSYVQVEVIQETLDFFKGKVVEEEEKPLSIFNVTTFYFLFFACVIFTVFLSYCSYIAIDGYNPDELLITTLALRLPFVIMPFLSAHAAMLFLTDIFMVFELTPFSRFLKKYENRLNIYLNEKIVSSEKERAYYIGRRNFKHNIGREKWTVSLVNLCSRYENGKYSFHYNDLIAEYLKGWDEAEASTKKTA